MRITDVLRRKGNTVVTISPDATVRDLLASLSEHRVGALVVSADGVAVEGIVSERDVVRSLCSEGDGVLNRPVRVIMTETVKTCLPEDSTDDLMAAMTQHRIRHVPVLVDGRLAGIVSIGDVVKGCVEELQSERDQLTAYITG
jgi:CBS domain-containing protein